MASRKLPRKPDIKLEKVSESNSKFTFTVELTASWDWNMDVANKHQRLRAMKNNLPAAFQDLVAEEIFSHLEGMFDTVKLCSAQFTPEMLQAYDTYRKIKQCADIKFKTDTEQAEFQKALEIVNKYIAK